jgi:septal ring factor EnvC (AmiA/AmiB activator)
VLTSLLAALLMTTPTPAPAPPNQAEVLARNIAAYQQLSEDLVVTISQIGVIQRQVDGLQTQIGERRAIAGRIATAAYQQQRSNTLNALLTAETREDALERLLLMTGVGQVRQREIAGLSQTSERFVTAQRTLEALRAQQKTQQQDLIAQRLKIDQLRAVNR